MSIVRSSLRTSDLTSARADGVLDLALDRVLQPALRVGRSGGARFVLLGFAALVLLLSTAALLPGGATGMRGVDLLADASSLVAVVSCLVAVRGLEGRAALTWSCFAAMATSWLVADLLWTLDEQWLDAPGVARAADLLYLAGVLPCLLGILAVPVGRWEDGARARLLLDVLVLTTAGVLVADALVLRDLLLTGPDGAGLVTLVYPVLDVLVVATAVTLGRRRDGRPRPDLLLLAGAFLVWTLTDLAYAWVEVSGTDYFATPVGVGYVVGPLLLSAAALHGSRESGEESERGVLVRHAGSRLLAPLPELLVLGAGVVALLRGPGSWHEWTLIGLGASLAAWRQVLMALDAHELRSTLEQRVGARTEELRDLAERHQQILGSVAEGIFGVDPQGRITFVNAAAERLLGVPATELLGRPACDALCPPDHPACPLTGSRCPAPDRQREALLRRRDAPPLPVDVVVRPLSAQGPGDGAVVCFRDASERRRVEEMKRHFVSSVSHELRTPLSAIRGSLEMLADGDAGRLPGPAHDLVVVAERGTNRLSRLVDDILDVEGLTSGEFEVVRRPVVVRDVVEETLQALEPLAHRAGVTLVVDVVEGVASCDADRVGQALTNLVGNAVKFTPPGRSVHLAAAPVGDEVVVTVRDEGRGIPADDLVRVFDRFHQVPTGEVNEHGGTGLGLSIAKSIVERHGGRIWAESPPGRGATFTFTLPVTLPDSRPDSRPDSGPDPRPDSRVPEASLVAG